MKTKSSAKTLPGSVHLIPKDHKLLGNTSPQEAIMVTLILRRIKAAKGAAKLRDVKDFTAKAGSVRPAVDRKSFAASFGADPKEIEQVLAFAREHGLQVKETNPAARSVVLSGAAATVNKVFGVKLKDYQGEVGKYHSHVGPVKLPAALAKIVEAVIGLHSRPAHARAHNTARRQTSGDPANTKPVTPQEIAQLYSFPAGDGAGQTIGIYEMTTEDPQTRQLVPAGYLPQDVANTLKGFGGSLKVPKLVNVAIDGVGNSGVNDGETLLDITVGNVNGASFDEYVWNDVGAGGPGATGGGVSAKFPVPNYQNGIGVPNTNYSNKPGRGIPDLAGNASENSGYMQNAAGYEPQPVGGTSAVSPLYAGLFARINSNLGVSVGFVNPVIYSLGNAAFHDIVAPPGPLNNSFNGVKGYPVTKGWDACTGWGSVNGAALQNGLKAAKAGSKMPAT